jgi:hypothetical protein
MQSDFSVIVIDDDDDFCQMQPEAQQKAEVKTLAQIAKFKNSVIQPIKYNHHFPMLKKRKYKTLKSLDLRVNPSVKFQKIKRVFKTVKYISKMKIEYQAQKNFQYLYSIFSHKVMALEMDKIINAPKDDKILLSRRLREYRYVRSLKVGDIKPENETFRQKEVNAFIYSVQALRKLEAISFIGLKNVPFLCAGMSKILPYLTKIKKLEVPIDALLSKDTMKFHYMMERIKNLQEFKFEINESTLADRVHLFKNFVSTHTDLRKLTMVVNNAELKVDLSTLNDIEILEIIYELSENLASIAQNAPTIQNLILPVTLDWKVNPSHTHNHIVAEELMASLSQLKNIKKMTQNYSFQDELSMLNGCYPIWKDVTSYYNFQMLETLTLGVFLNDTTVEKFQTLFIESLRNMHRLRVLGLTLHNDGSSSKRFHLTGPILDLTRVIGMLPCLSEFEFNTEIEIMLNILTEFFRGLTQLKNLRKFKSEWLQINQASFKAFAKRLHQMKNLELLDIHLYSLYDIPKKDLDTVFASLGESLEKMPNLKAMQITADNECFTQENVWQQWQDTLRAKCGKKFIELTLAETE